MTACIPKQELLTSFFESSLLPSLILHAETLQIIKANAAAATFFHYTATALESLSFIDLLQNETDSPYELLKKFNTSLAPSHVLSCKTGNQITTTQVFINALAAEEGLLAVTLVPVATLAVLDDEEKLLAGIVNENADVLTASDLEFKPITWSKAAERLYGITREQAIGKDLRTYTEIYYNHVSRQEVHHQLRTAGMWRGEMSFVRPTDRKKITLLITFKLIRNEAGAPKHYVISGTDITDRKEVEAKLQESENRFREVANSAPVGIWMIDEKEQDAYINKPLANFIGIESETSSKAAWLSRIHPEDVHEVLKMFETSTRQAQAFTNIYRMRHNTGTYRWVQDSVIPRQLSNGAFIGYIGSVIDIHDQKQREVQLQYQAMLMEHVLDSVVTTNLDFVVQSCNQVAVELYGYAEAEMIGKRLPELAPFKFVEVGREQALSALKNAGIWKGEVDIDLRGEERNFLYTVRYITTAAGDRIGIMAVGREITDRKRAERKLLQSEAFYRTLIADSVDGKLLTGADGIITFASPSIKTIFGYSPEDVLGRNMFEFVHIDDHPVALTAFQLELSETPEVKSVEVRVLKKDGTWLWCSARGHNLLSNPQIASIVVSLHDDTQRKKATDALKESEQRFRDLIKDLRLGVTLKNADGQVVMYNKATADLFGVPEVVLDGANIYDLLKKLVHEDETPFERKDWPALRAARTKKPVNDVVVGIKVNDAVERVWLLVNANPVLDGDGNIRHIISSFTNVTEHKKLTQRLLEERLNQQRLLTQATIDGQERERKEIGKELHDNIGQQLATTKLYLDLATGNPDAADMLARAAKSISNIINEVRAVSHSLVPPMLGDLGLIESIHELAENISLGQKLKINFKHYPFNEDSLPENAKLMLYRIIQEALNNIIKHAGARTVHIRLKRTARAVSLQVQDNGCGFELDKTRKGLGLSNIRNRAELFGGTVRIRTAPGAGCTLHVSIPNKSLTALQPV